MIIVDDDLGKIRLVENVRAKRIIVRKKDGYLQLTHPSSVNLSYIREVLEEMKPRLLKLAKKETERFYFSPSTDFSTFSFTLKIIESPSANNYYMSLKDEILTISCPANTDYEDQQVQQYLRTLVEKALRYEANRLFPSKVTGLARKHGFSVNGIKINKSRSRWGSCNSKKSINLSYFCMLLPEYLVDFVILHELCHTVEMNHGEHFWKLLDNVSGNKGMELTQELKSFKTKW